MSLEPLDNICGVQSVKTKKISVTKVRSVDELYIFKGIIITILCMLISVIFYDNFSVHNSQSLFMQIATTLLISTILNVRT